MNEVCYIRANIRSYRSEKCYGVGGEKLAFIDNMNLEFCLESTKGSMKATSKTFKKWL